jgi:hypothetical protein
MQDGKGAEGPKIGRTLDEVLSDVLERKDAAKVSSFGVPADSTIVALPAVETVPSSPTEDTLPAQKITSKIASFFEGRKEPKLPTWRERRSEEAKNKGKFVGHDRLAHYIEEVQNPPLEIDELHRQAKINEGVLIIGDASQHAAAALRRKERTSVPPNPVDEKNVIPKLASDTLVKSPAGSSEKDASLKLTTLEIDAVVDASVHKVLAETIPGNVGELTLLHLEEGNDLSGSLTKLLQKAMDSSDFKLVFQIITTFVKKVDEVAQKTNSKKDNDKKGEEKKKDYSLEINLGRHAFTKLIFFDILRDVRQAESQIKAWGKKITGETLAIVELVEKLMSVEGLLPKITQFWVDYVNRPAYYINDKYERNNPKGEPLAAPGKLMRYKERGIRDKELSGEPGSYCLEAAGDPFHSFDFVFYFLHTQLYGHASENGKFVDTITHVRRPSRDNETYWVRFVNASTGLAVKVPVSLSELGGVEGATAENCLRFRKNIAERIAKLSSDPRSVVDYGDLCTKPGSKARNNKVFNLLQTESVIGNPQSIDACDLGVVYADRVSDNNLKKVQTSSLYNNAVGTPFIVEIPLSRSSKDGLGNGQITMKGAHSSCDAKYMQNLCAVSMGEAQKVLAAEELQAETSSAGETVRNRKQLGDLLQIDKLQRFLHQFDFDQNKYVEAGAESTVETAQLDWTEIHKNNRLKELTTLWNEKFEIALSPAILETYTLMIVLGLEHAHFLGFNKENKSLAPVLTLLTEDVREEIKAYAQRVKNRETIPTVDKEVKKRLFLEIYNWHLDKKDAEGETGNGIIPVMAVISQRLQKFLSTSGNITFKGATEMLTSTALFSTLSIPAEFKSPYQLVERNNQAKIRFTGFTTAFASIYNQVIGTIKVERDKTVITRRLRKGDLAQLAHPNLNDECQPVLEALVSVLEDVGKSLPSMTKKNSESV